MKLKANAFKTSLNFWQCMRGKENSEANACIKEVFNLHNFIKTTKNGQTIRNANIN